MLHLGRGFLAVVNQRNAAIELERLAGSVIVCGFDGSEVPADVRTWITSDTLAGLILFKRNIEDASQAADMIAAATQVEDSARPLLVCVDQEGGRVARFGPPIVELPPMRTLASAGDLDLTTLGGRVLGRQLRAVGINLNFAPVLDVDTNPANPVIGDRAFGATPQEVTDHGLAFAHGLHEGGVLSCAKHFPGHGDTDVDSHHALPVLRHDRTRLDDVELRPFRSAVGTVPSVMTAHVVIEELDTAPATLSSALIDGLLRDEIGFTGAVFTDDLEMKAVSAQYPVEESGVLAIEAGCDILLVCSDIEAAGRLREALVREAEATPGFAAKLEAACTRADALRKQVTQLPTAIGLRNALDDPDARRLRERLEASA
ncbi:MAG: beta-N-acetylhexosaminidase [Myxococcota bacterium]